MCLVDLALSSAPNLIARVDERDAEGSRIEDTTLRLSVLGRGKWGEVVFACFDLPATEPLPESGDRAPVVTPTPPDDADGIAPEKRAG